MPVRLGGRSGTTLADFRAYRIDFASYYTNRLYPVQFGRSCCSSSAACGRCSVGFPHSAVQMITPAGWACFPSFSMSTSCVGFSVGLSLFRSAMSAHAFESSVQFNSPAHLARIPERPDQVREEPEIVMGLAVGANRLTSNSQISPASSS